MIDWMLQCFCRFSFVLWNDEKAGARRKIAFTAIFRRFSLSEHEKNFKPQKQKRLEKQFQCSNKNYTVISSSIINFYYLRLCRCTNFLLFQTIFLQNFVSNATAINSPRILYCFDIFCCTSN